MFVGTQPIEWTEPPSAKVVDLLPLSREEAERFLLTRPVGGDTAQKIHDGAYANAVRAFLHWALDEAPSEENRQATELVLSNPFDLTLAADLLAQGAKPARAGGQRDERLVHPSLSTRGDHDRCSFLRRGLSCGEAYSRAAAHDYDALSVELHWRISFRFDVWTIHQKRLAYAASCTSPADAVPVCACSPCR
jgi:hypothetical protein